VTDCPQAIEVASPGAIIVVEGGCVAELTSDAAGVLEVNAVTAVSVETPAQAIGVFGIGPRGEPGPAGPAGASFNFSQSSPALLWTINHGLGFRPNVQLFTVGGVEFEAQILHTSNIQTLVYHNSPIAGTARLV